MVVSCADRPLGSSPTVGSMTPAELLSDAFTRVLDDGLAVLEDLDEAMLATPPHEGANPIGWLVWHLTRVQDDHIADVAGTEQVWTAEGFVDRFDLPLDAGDTGFGHSAEQVRSVRAPAALLADYLGATHEATLGFLATVEEPGLDRVVDTRWDPPVTLGVRLVSVVNDCTQHVGQAAYARGLLRP